MRLTQLFTGEKKTEDAGRNQSASGGNAPVSRQIRSLTPGQTIQGEVIARNGSEVQVRISEDLVLNARVDRNMNLEIGRNMTFEVKNNGSLLTLSPLFENMATDANVLKALDMASLPVNQITVTMTEQLMKAGLPIDRNSLVQVYREVNAFPQADVSDVVDLHRLGLPVNENNLNQIASYKNLTYQLENGMNHILEALPETFHGMLQEGNVEGAAKLFQELFLLLQDNTEGNPQGQGMQGITEMFAPDGEVTGGMIKEGSPAGGIAAGEAQSAAAGVFSEEIFPTKLPAAEERFPRMEEGMQNSRTEETGDSAVKGQITAEGSRTDGAEAGRGGVRHNGMELLEITLQGQSGTKNTALSELLGKIFASAAQGDIKGLQELQNALAGRLQEAWTIRPEEVADEKQVQELYGRLDRQLKNMTRALEGAGQTGTEAHRAASGLSKNLDFLQQVNQAYTYVQLPLRMQQGRAHGDLYVFTNKKHLAAKEGQISALLHLDMENLGPVDIYVAMQSQKVNTKFYVQDDEMLDFLEQHMELLTERLQKRGYDCSFDMLVRESREGGAGGVRRLLEQANHIPLAQYAFDMRA